MNRKLLIFPIGSEYIQNAISTPYSDSLYLRPALCVSLYRYCPHFLSSSDKPTLYHLITNKKKTIDKDFPFFSVFVFNRADLTKMLFNVFPHLTYPLKVIEVGQKKCANLFIFLYFTYMSSTQRSTFRAFYLLQLLFKRLANCVDINLIFSI